MPLRVVRQLGDPILRRKAKTVERLDTLTLQLIDDMAQTMYEAPGVGLAAPQVGVSKRIIVVDAGEGLHVLVNPRILESEGKEWGTEGCLSIPLIYGEVERAQTILVKGMDHHGKRVKLAAEGLLARAIQHEMDHLDGRLFIDMAINLREVKPETVEEEEGSRTPPARLASAS
ncbi:MAG: peptide deformylase [Armatimonadetes bacterium]|nr:peptide deformylase [Armatimonadota bacterium]